MHLILKGRVKFELPLRILAQANTLIMVGISENASIALFLLYLVSSMDEAIFIIFSCYFRHLRIF